MAPLSSSVMLAVAASSGTITAVQPAGSLCSETIPSINAWTVARSAAGSHCSLSAAWSAAARTMEGLQLSRCSVRRRVPGMAAAPAMAASVGAVAKLPPQTTLPGVARMTICGEATTGRSEASAVAGMLAVIVSGSSIW